MHILGRKLYAAFEKKAGKIEIINHKKSIALLEQHISLHPISITGKKNKANMYGGEQVWSLYFGIVKQLSTLTDPVKPVIISLTANVVI